MFSFQGLRPDSIYRKMTEVPLDELRRRGYRAALLDMDNTIVHDHAEQPSAYSVEVIKKLRTAGFLCCVVSNAKSGRSAELSKALDVPCVSYAGKPGTGGIVRALELLDVKKEEAVFFGDQLFTDIAAAKRAGILAVLIEPLEKKEVFYVRLKRPLEWVVRRLGRF